MKSGLLALAGMLAAGFASAQEPAPESDCWYAGGAGALVLPQGGARMHRLGGGAVRLGCYLTDAFAVDAEAARAEDKTALAARALCHFRAWDWWDMMFGYERFDPFLAVGAKGWFDHGQAGPAFGLGALYYLTDHWALRADAELVLGFDSGAETIHSLSFGAQYSF